MTYKYLPILSGNLSIDVEKLPEKDMQPKIYNLTETDETYTAGLYVYDFKTDEWKKFDAGGSGVDDLTIGYDSEGRLIVKNLGINTAQLNDNAVTTDKIKDGAVTKDKIDEDAGVVFRKDIVDDLTSDDVDKPLSAKQGKLLKETIDKVEPWTFTLADGTEITKTVRVK